MRQEIKSLTGLRGIAALWVVVFHYFSYIDITFIRTFIRSGYLAVDIFFILSAFVLTIAYKSKFHYSINIKDLFIFYKKRINRIYPIYLISILIIILIKGVTLKQLIINITLTQTFFDWNGIILNSSYWSLSTEWICYIIFPILLLFTNNLTIKKLIILILGGIILRFSLPFLPDMAIGVEKFRYHPPGADFPIGINSFIRTISCYLLGIGIALFPWRSKNNNTNIIILTFLTIISLFIPKGVFISPILVAVIIKLLSLNENDIISKLLNNKIIYFLGEISYSLYLFHIIFSHMDFTPFNNMFWDRVLWLILSIIISTITYHLIEKKVKFFKV